MTSPDDEVRYQNRWMFTPAVVLAAVDPEPGVTLIRTKDGDVHRYDSVKCPCQSVALEYIVVWLYNTFSRGLGL